MGSVSVYCFGRLSVGSAGSIALALWYHLVVCRTEWNNSHHHPGRKRGKAQKDGDSRLNSTSLKWSSEHPLGPTPTAPPSSTTPRASVRGSSRDSYPHQSSHEGGHLWDICQICVFFFSCILQNPVQEEVLHRTDLEFPEFIFHVRWTYFNLYIPSSIFKFVNF